MQRRDRRWNLPTELTLRCGLRLLTPRFARLIDLASSCRSVCLLTRTAALQRVRLIDASRRSTGFQRNPAIKSLAASRFDRGRAAVNANSHARLDARCVTRRCLHRLSSSETQVGEESAQVLRLTRPRGPALSTRRPVAPRMCEGREGRPPSPACPRAFRYELLRA